MMKTLTEWVGTYTELQQAMHTYLWLILTLFHPSMALNGQYYIFLYYFIFDSDLPLNAIIVIEHCSHKRSYIKNM